VVDEIGKIYLNDTISQDNSKFRKIKIEILILFILNLKPNVKRFIARKSCVKQIALIDLLFIHSKKRYKSTQ
jgi:hypothetical protein